MSSLSKSRTESGLTGHSPSSVVLAGVLGVLLVSGTFKDLLDVLAEETARWDMLLLGEIVWFGLVRFGLAVLGRARLESEQEREEEAGVPGVRGVNPSLGCTIVGTRSVRLRWAVAAPPRPPSSPGSTV